MSHFTDPEEPPTEEFDPDYTDDLGDDLPGAMPHPFVDPIMHCKYLELLVHYLYVLILLIGCNLTPAHPVVRLDAAILLVTTALLLLALYL
jgi:hypothetical protein